MAECCKICLEPLETDDAFGCCSRCISSVLTAVEDPDGNLALDPKSLCETYVGDYEVLDLIGSGGLASVYRARDASLDRIVALKWAHPGSVIGDVTLDRFQIEAEAATALSHLNVVQVFSSGAQDGRPYLAMEFMGGGSLADRFEEFSLAQSKLSPEEFTARLDRAATLMLKIARGVQHAHERAILHRDLKPSNVLLDASGEPKVADFGLAQSLGDNHDRTLSQAVIATSNYTAPEFAHGGARSATVACDVYSLGAMLHHLLAGAPPCQAEATLEPRRRAEDRTLATLNIRVPVDLALICLKCIAREPSDRYASAGALADDLQRFLTHQPIIARPVAPLAKLVVWCRLHPAQAAGVALLAAALLAGASGLAWQWWHATRTNRALVEREARLNQELRLSTALRLASQARHELDESPPRALLLASEAVAAARGTDTQSAASAALLETLNQVGGFPLCGPTPAAGLASVSPDGQWFARIHADGQASLRHLERAGLEFRWAAHAVAACGLGWVDAKTLCTAGSDGLLKLWRIEDNAEAKLLAETSMGEPILRLAVMPGARKVAALGGSGALRLWPIMETDFGEPVSAGEYSKPEGMEAAADGNRFVIFHGGRQATLATLSFGAAGIRTVARWDLKQNATVARFSSDNHWVSIGGTDNEGWLFDLSSASEKPTGFLFGKLLGEVKAMAFSPDNQWVACVGNSKGMMLWKLGQPSTSAPIPVRMGGYRNNTLAFSPDSKTIFTGGDDHAIQQISLGSLASAPRVSMLRGLETEVNEILVPPMSNVLLAVGSDGSVRQWNLDRPSGAAFSASPELPRPVRDVRYTPDGAWLVAATDDGNLYGWSATKEMSPEYILHGHRAEVCAMAFAPDGRWLVSASYDGSVRWWDWQARMEGRSKFSDRVLLELPPPAHVRGVAVHPGDGRVVMGGGAGLVRVVSTNTDAVVQSFQLEEIHDLRALTLSHDGRWLALGGLTTNGSVVEIRDFDSLVAGPNRKVATSGSVETLAFSRDDRWLAVGGLDRVVHVWDLHDTNSATKAYLAPFSAGAIGKLDFAPDGQTLAIASWDGTVRLWPFLDPAAATPVLSLPLGVRACAFSPDGRRLAAGGYDSRVTVFDLDLDVLLARAREISGRDLTPAERARFGIGPAR